MLPDLSDLTELHGFWQNLLAFLLSGPFAVAILGFIQWRLDRKAKDKEVEATAKTSAQQVEISKESAVEVGQHYLLRDQNAFLETVRADRDRLAQQVDLLDKKYDEIHLTLVKALIYMGQIKADLAQARLIADQFAKRLNELPIVWPQRPEFEVKV